MKKLFSTLAASVMAVSALTAVSSSAVNATDDNSLVVSTETLAAAITADNGTVIPAGAVAITVNISDNAGFCSSMTKLNLGSADVIVDEEGAPVVDAGEALGESLICGSENNGIVAFATASADESTIDGEMFTFYAANVDSVSIVNSEIAAPVSSNNNISLLSAYSGIYIVGDVNNDTVITATDASAVLAALKKAGRTSIPFASVKALPTYYFPSIATARAAFIWDAYDTPDANMTPLTSTTSTEILDYYAAQQTGGLYSGSSHLGEAYPY